MRLLGAGLVLALGLTGIHADPRQDVLDAALSQLGVTEATGHNDGEKVDAFLATVGLEGSGAPWCACFNRWSYDRAGLRKVGPRSALAAAWVASPTWTRADGGRTPLPGDTWGIWIGAGVHHTGMVEKWGDQVVTTVEGNTAPQAIPGSAQDREGDGVWRKRRLVRQIYSAKNWIGD